MKLITKLFRSAVLSLILSTPLVIAQEGSASVVAATALTRTPISDTGTVPTYELSLKWTDDLSTVLSVPLANPGKNKLTVLGAQATSGIFVSDYPPSLAAGKTDSVSFIYNAAANSDGDTELIRLLTDQGVKEIRVRLTREKVVEPDVREVQWTVGEKAVAKTVTLKIAAGTVKPVKVTAGGDNRAALTPVNATTWAITITPGSTAKIGKFPVFVEFDRSLPGTATVILGSIQPAQ